MTDEKPCRTVLDKLFDYVNYGVGWGAEQRKSACPPRKKKSKLIDPEREERSSPMLDKSDPCPQSPCPEKPPYVLPSQMCPKRETCCSIKMQDPCAPCCCEAKPRPPPCPPKCYPQEPRPPTCGCDYCKKGYVDGKCCDPHRTYHGTTADPKYFEKA